MGQPNPLRADAVSLLILKSVHPASLLEDSLPLLGQGRLVVLGNMHDLPVVLVH